MAKPTIPHKYLGSVIRRWSAKAEDEDDPLDVEVAREGDAVFDDDITFSVGWGSDPVAVGRDRPSSSK